MTIALSDIFAAAVDRLVGEKAETDTWYIGEDLAVSGLPFRDMSDPVANDNTDYYPGKWESAKDMDQRQKSKTKYIDCL